MSDHATTPLTLVEVEYDWPTIFPPRPLFRTWSDLRRGRVADYPYFTARYVLPPDWAGTDYADGEWTARWPHERVEHDGFEVPVFLPEPDRTRWLADPRARLRGLRWRALRWGHVR